MPGVFLRPIAAWRYWNLAVTADLAEADVGDAELLAKSVDGRFPKLAGRAARG